MDPDSIHYYKKSVQGAQGIVGECLYRGETCVFKKSNTVDDIIALEYDMMKLMEPVPHFCRTKGYENGMVFMEKYNNTTLGDLIALKHQNESASVIQQTIASVAWAQEIARFTHYDLHTDNILVEPTPYDYHTYLLPSGDRYTIKTYGVAPVIIDFGYAYADGLTPLRTILEYMSEGYTTYEYDALADMRLFVTALIYDMTKYDPTHAYLTLLKPLFKRLPLNPRSGWYHQGVFNSALSRLKTITPLVVSKSSLFNRSNANGSLEHFNRMSALPLTPPTACVSDEDYRDIFKVFLKRWIPVEKSFDTKRDRKLALTKYLQTHAHDATVLAIVSKIQEILWSTKLKNNIIRDRLYAKLSVTSVKDVLDTLVSFSPPPPPLARISDRVKVFGGGDEHA